MAESSTSQYEKKLQAHGVNMRKYCIHIRTRGGIYGKIWPEPEGFPEGSDNISSYTPTQVTIQSFSITSTSQYFLLLTP